MGTRVRAMVARAVAMAAWVLPIIVVVGGAKRWWI